jgi:hypothetical protein
MYSKNDVNVFEEWCHRINEWCQFIITLNIYINKMSKSLFFSNASISRLTLLSSHTSRNFRFNFFVLFISSIIKSRRSFSRNHHNLINNFLFINSFLLFDCSSFFNFAFFFSSSLFLTRLSSISNLREDQKSNSEKD